ncbi:MAG TPA: hypothetical protein VMH38_00590, partial [Thermoplasmata archaeon]|nr:hypothetical protein [Thermoplasmata archaeon]
AKEFQQNNSNIVISVNQGGSGAGRLAVCSGAVDIGEASSYTTVATLISSYGCPTTAVITTVAYDAVDPIVPAGNTHGLVSISSDTMLSIYYAASSTSPAAALGTMHIDGQIADGTHAATVTTFNTPLEWVQIPACVIGQTNCNGAITEAVDTHSPAIVAGGGAACGADICDGTSSTGTPCGFTVCAGPLTSMAKTVVNERSDISGTEQTFTAKVLGIQKTNVPCATYACVATEFDGCGSDGQLSSCGIAVAGENGNPAVISATAGNPDGIGFASDGLVKASGSGVTGIPLAAWGQSTATSATLGSSGTIATAIKDPSGTTPAGEYAGWRPFEMITQNTPTGEVYRFMQWVLDPANNINVAADASEISIYSV